VTSVRERLDVGPWLRRRSVPVRVFVLLPLAAPAIASFLVAIFGSLRRADVVLICFVVLLLCLFQLADRFVLRRNRPPREPRAADLWITRIYLVGIALAPFIAAIRATPWWLLALPSAALVALGTPYAPKDIDAPQPKAWTGTP
jgi:hypothetical protein